MKILIVDDNGVDRALLRYNFERHGYRDIIEARDGMEGLESARAYKPDLIISDALMPKMDGFQFLRRVKTDDDLKAIPFIFYSAVYTGFKEAELAVSLGAAVYIVKPKEPEEFWNEIVYILKKREAESREPQVAVPPPEEKEYLREHSEIVTVKLQEKIKELEKAIERQKKVEEELRHSEEFIKNILETVDEGFIVVDREYRIISANKAYCSRVQKPLKDILGKHCYEVSHHFHRPCHEIDLECAVKQTFETGEPHTSFHTHFDENGQVYVETKSYPVRNDMGEITAVIEIINDITEKKKLEDQLRHSQKMEAVGQIAGGIAHDFNNILTAIIGYANLMQMKMDKNNPLRINLDNILASALRASTLTESLLAFSRKQVNNPVIVDIKNLVEKTKKFLDRVIGEDIELKISLTGEKLPVLADASQIEQVFMNLATNARDAMPDGGAISISTELVKIDRFFKRMHGFGESGNYALISVADTGTGMDEETRERIFEPFFTTKEMGKSTGLGLSMVYGIIKQHNGYISCYSEPGKGTIFKIYLPLTKELQVKEIPQVDVALPMGGKETVLIAEDETTVRRLEKTVLEEFGYTVIEAKDGEEAVNKFMSNRNNVDLLLLDLIMPKMNGKEVYEKIKEVKPGIKTLFVSGYPTEFTQKKEIIDEGLDFLSKPIPPVRLLKEVRKALSK